MIKYILLLKLFIIPLFSQTEYIELDASSYTEWVYFSFLTHSEVIIDDPENSIGWDIAFMRNHIKTNSGTSGIGAGGVYIDSLNLWTNESFENITEVPLYAEFEIDTMMNTFYDIITHTMSWGSTNPNLETWGDFDFENNYTLEPSNNQLIVRTANGNNFIKIWPYNYYNDVGNSGHISVLYNDDIDCMLGMDYCDVCGGNNDSCLLDGDVNQDSNINILDVIELLSVILSYETSEINYEILDINQDSNIDIFDIILLVDLIINVY